MINASASKLHWNYFVALERDLDAVSRYVEFAPANFDVYSIELAHLLFAAASEVDVVAKLLCTQIDPEARRANINHYRQTLTAALPGLVTTQVTVARHGLTMTPWDNWGEGTNPDWWKSYNKVKHERHSNFHRATLKNALNAMSALLVLNYEYYTAVPTMVECPPPVILSGAKDLNATFGDSGPAPLAASVNQVEHRCRHEIIDSTGDTPRPEAVTNTLEPESVLLRLSGP